MINLSNFKLPAGQTTITEIRRSEAGKDTHGGLDTANENLISRIVGDYKYITFKRCQDFLYFDV